MYKIQIFSQIEGYFVLKPPSCVNIFKQFQKSVYVNKHLYPHTLIYTHTHTYMHLHINKPYYMEEKGL